jgi:hypothetical protein
MVPNLFYEPIQANLFATIYQHPITEFVNPGSVSEVRQGKFWTSSTGSSKPNPA